MKRYALAAVLVLNGQPAGNLVQAGYTRHVADAQTKSVVVHAKSLQRWQYSGNVLTIDSDQVFLQGFEK